MAERDRFELDLAAALRTYLEEAPTEVRPTELARQFATAYPHGTTTSGLWHLVAVPRRAWILLLLAGLVAALVGGTLFVGSQPERKLPAVVPPVAESIAPSVAPAFVCPAGTNPDEAGPVDQARPAGLPAQPGRMAFDRRAGRLVALAGNLPVETWTSPVETWTFDVCTNTWTRMRPNQEPPSGTDGLVYDVDSDLTVASDGTRTWVYDLKANTWREKGLDPPFSGLIRTRFYDPVSGLVVAVGDDGDEDTLGLALWGYDVETDTWTPIPQAKPLTIGPHYEDFAYDASVDRLVAYASTWKDKDPPNGDWLFEPRTWLFDIRTGTWSGTGAATPQYSYGIWGIQPGIAYDEAARRTVMLAQGQSAAYDATADRWETLYVGTPWDEQGACGSRPECRTMPHLVYDPVNERLVVYGGRGTVYLSADMPRVYPDDVLAFDTRTREWTVLLEASQPVTLP